MAIPETFSQIIHIPPDTPSEVNRYIYALLESYDGFPGFSRWSREKGELLNVVFTSPNSLGSFLEAYGQALRGKFIVPIWEKVNGPIISDKIKDTLSQFHSLMISITPAFEFIMSNGGWAVGKEFKGLLALRGAIFSKTASPKVSKAHDTFCIEMTRFTIAAKCMIGRMDTLKIHRTLNSFSSIQNICDLYIDFGVIYRRLEPFVQYIESNGGWVSEDGTFPGFDALRHDVSSGKLSKEHQEAFEQLTRFMEVLELGRKFILLS